jgi:hypothetical protein
MPRQCLIAMQQTDSAESAMLTGKSAKEQFTGFESNACRDVDNYPATTAFSIST